LYLATAASFKSAATHIGYTAASASCCAAGRIFLIFVHGFTFYV